MDDHNWPESHVNNNNQSYYEQNELSVNLSLQSQDSLINSTDSFRDPLGSANSRLNISNSFSNDHLYLDNNNNTNDENCFQQDQLTKNLIQKVTA